MENIGRSIGLSTYTDQDYWALFLEYLRMDFEPVARRLAIIKIAKKHKEDCIILQRAFEKRPGRYIPAMKNKRILDQVEEWKAEDRYEYRERDR